METLITEHVVSTARHMTTYLQAGPKDGPLIIFVHGYPDLATSWRHQMRFVASMGFRAIAPNMRGYAGSSVPDDVEAYATEENVKDLLELLEGVGSASAIWVGHDAGAAAVWGLASHHPEACVAVAGLSIPYLPNGFSLESVSSLVNREIYPADQFPNGQWGYWAFQVEHPDQSAAELDSNVEAALRMIFRITGPEVTAAAAGRGTIAAPHGWSLALEHGKSVPLSTTVLDEQTYCAYVASIKRNGFRPINSYYRNSRRNFEYAKRAVNGGKLDMPALFIHALYDASCMTANSDLPKPMRQYCSKLTEARIPASHWLQQEKPMAVNAALAHWLATRVPNALLGQE